jgi:hypothetical protein
MLPRREADTYPGHYAAADLQAFALPPPTSPTEQALTDHMRGSLKHDRMEPGTSMPLLYHLRVICGSYLAALPKSY